MKNKILALLHLPPPDYGVTLLNKDIVEGSLNEHFKFDIISINTSKRMKDIQHFSFVKIPAFLNIFYVLLKKLLRNNYCLCYFSLTPTGVAFYKDLFFVLLIKMFRIRILYHLHGKGISLKPSPLKDFLYRFCFKNSKVIIISQSLFYDIAKYVSNKDVYVLPNGIKEALADFDFERILDERLSNKAVNLLFLSNMIKSKGVFNAIESARILKDKGYHFRFYFAGEWFDISQGEFAERINVNGLNGEIRYLGFKNSEQKKAIFKETDIFVYPTYNDTFPLVLLEAMQFGLPIVSTYEGAIPDVVDEGVTGLLVAKKDSMALAERIENLINNLDLRIKMGKAARERFLRKYTFDKFEKNLLDIFREVASH